MSKTEIEFNKYQKRGAYHWQQIAKNIFTFNAYVSARYQQIVNLLPASTPLRLLDIGCGDGVLDYLIYQKTKAHITGIDPDLLAINYAQQAFTKRQAKAKFIQANAYHLPFKPNRFDLVILAEVIEHLSRTKKLLAEIKRVLKPNGQLIITTPVKLSSIPEDKMHVKEYTPQELFKLLHPYFPNPTITTSHPQDLKKLYLLKLIKLGRFHFEPFRWLINLWVMLTQLNPFLLSSKSDTNQIAVCFKS